MFGSNVKISPCKQLALCSLATDKCGQPFSNILSEPGCRILQVGHIIAPTSHANSQIGQVFGGAYFLGCDMYT